MEHKFISQKNFRYQIVGNIEKATKLIFVFHGYGQLAEFFIRKFKELPENYLVVAPEGMHRFYLNGTSGRVGASWMTKDDRESDIQDNIHWLSQLFEEINQKKKFEKSIILGFSQGGATAARWFFSGKINANQLILWASVFPPDLEKPEIKEKSSNYFVIGDNDEYYFEHQQIEEIEFYQKIGFQTKTFGGKHDIEINTLLSILKEI